MTDILLTYLLTCLASYVTHQGPTWWSLFEVSRFIKCLGWPALLFRPFIATEEEKKAVSK